MGFKRVENFFAGSMEFLGDHGKSTYVILDNREPGKKPEILWVDFRQESYGWLKAYDMDPNGHRRHKQEKSFVR